MYFLSTVKDDSIWWQTHNYRFSINLYFYRKQDISLCFVFFVLIYIKMETTKLMNEINFNWKQLGVKIVLTVKKLKYHTTARKWQTWANLFRTNLLYILYKRKKFDFELNFWNKETIKIFGELIRTIDFLLKKCLFLRKSFIKEH